MSKRTVHNICVLYIYVPKCKLSALCELSCTYAMINVTVDQFTNSEVKDPGLLNLIARLTGLLLQVEVSIQKLCCQAGIFTMCAHRSRVYPRVVTRLTCPL